MSSAAAAFLLEYRATRIRKRKKGGKKRERERDRARAKKKGVRTSDDFFEKPEFARRLMKKRTITSRRVIR